MSKMLRKTPTMTSVRLAAAPQAAKQRMSSTNGTRSGGSTSLLLPPSRSSSEARALDVATSTTTHPCAASPARTYATCGVGHTGRSNEGWSVQLRRHLRRDQLHLVEVGEVEQLQVDAGDAGFLPPLPQPVDHLGRRSGD